MKKYTIITILGVFINVICMSDAYCIKFLFFVDNTVYMAPEEESKSFFLQKLMQHLFPFVDKHGHSITFIPIGDHEDKKEAASLEEAFQIFQFNNQYMELSNSLKKMNKNDDNIEIVIISTFTPKHFIDIDERKISINDYKDLRDCTDIINKWAKNNSTIHLIQLVKEFYEPDWEMNTSNDSNKIYKSIIQSIERLESKSNQIEFISVKNRRKLINGWISELKSSSDQSLKKINHYQIEQDNLIDLEKDGLNDLIAITKGIVDTSKIETFRIKFIFDQHLFGKSKKHFKQFKRLAQKQLQRKGPSPLCNNPLRKAKYFVTNDDRTKNYYEYKYHIIPSPLRYHAHIELFHYDKTHKQYLKDPGHCVYQLSFKSEHDLLMKILCHLQQLRTYQKRDFKVLERYRTLQLLPSDDKALTFLKGYNLCIKPDNKTCEESASFLNNSSSITDSGECHMYIKFQGINVLCLISPQPDNNEKVFAWEFSTIEEHMLASNTIKLTKMNYPETEVIFSVDEKYKTSFPFLSVKINDIHQNDIFVIKKQKCQLIQKKLIPGHYCYHLQNPDDSSNKCLDQINKNFTIPFQPEKTFHLAFDCIPNEQINFSQAVTFLNQYIPRLNPKKQQLNVEAPIYSLITGFPPYFKHLLKYTSMHYINNEIPQRIKNIWQDVYISLFDCPENTDNDEMKRVSGKIKRESRIAVESIMKSLNCEDYDNYKQYFERMLNKICGKYTGYFTIDEQKIFLTILDRLETEQILSREFVQFLKKG